MKSNQDLVKGWINKAENDLKNAVHVLATMQEPPLDTVCFHAQQCVEKFLKAFLTFHNIEFPFIHELDELAELCSSVDKDFKEMVPRVRILIPYTVEIRYPEESPEISMEDAQLAVEIAKEVKELVIKKLPKR